MAAEKKGKATIVIKKTYINAGHHGGAWKVALADFMTAMMAFFMVMWLLGQSNETKKNIAEYFNTPSIIEYNYNNFGALLTLEKLFLDFINSPLEAIASFIRPMDRHPNILDFGSEAIVREYLNDQLLEVVESSQFIDVMEDGIKLVILDIHLFEKGTSRIAPKFIQNTEKLKAITMGLRDARLHVESHLFHESVADSDPQLARQVAIERLQVLVNRIQAGLAHSSVDVTGSIKVIPKPNYQEGDPRPNGFLTIEVRQKEQKEDGTRYRKLERIFGDAPSSGNVYQDFVNKITAPRPKQE
ncbi:MAG: chemotaxis protein MotB [Bdellovibrionaceae bacterium]|nr:chemotaxis protein MotB [Pseudobdellovibrionaceae bacterium]MDW8189838.1 flagellar motor protein MotB [Pseudobdellovibrionaceae bacterium]